MPIDILQCILVSEIAYFKQQLVLSYEILLVCTVMVCIKFKLHIIIRGSYEIILYFNIYIYIEFH